MEVDNNQSENWQSTTMKEIIHCPFQPGNLKISKKACLKRYQASSRTTWDSNGHINLFYYTVGQGLLRCRSCPIVEEMPDRFSNGSVGLLGNK
jgi:hypothetical protein